jgi:flagellum-specific peptidoglycan hydrolase FlgJ
MTASPQEFLKAAFTAATLAKHIFPEYAACEAALESAWGKSGLAVKANNLFGRKQSKEPVFETIDMPTHEYVHGEMVPTVAHWVKYPDWASCFDDRMALLRRLSVVTNEDGSLKFPEYLAALNADNGRDFVVNVSKKWSTDPERGTKVLEIYNNHKDALV